MMDHNQLRNERRKQEYLDALNQLDSSWRHPAIISSTILTWIRLSKPGSLPNYLRDRINRHLPVLRAAIRNNH